MELIVCIIAAIVIVQLLPLMGIVMVWLLGCLLERYERKPRLHA